MPAIELINLAAVLYAVMGIVYIAMTMRRLLRTQTEMAAWQRRKASLDLPSNHAELVKLFYRIPRSHHAARDSDDLTEEEQEAVLRAADFCETVAVGIIHGVYDEDTIKAQFAIGFETFYSTYAKMFYRLRDQRHDERVYIYFERLMERWKHDTADRNTFTRALDQSWKARS